MPKKEIEKVLDPQYYKQEPSPDDFDNFKKAFYDLIKSTKKIAKEDTNKNPLRDFLIEMGYERKNVKFNANYVDLSIHKDDDVPQVLIECKKLISDEIVTTSVLNKKAFHQIILYYLREKAKNNVFLTNIIITNNVEWFIFKSTDIEKLCQNKDVTNLFKNYNNKKTSIEKTSGFYNSLSQILTQTPSLLKNLDFINFSLKDDLSVDELKDIYKTLQPEYLLKTFIINDSNTLNKNFYDELLHIMGLQETKDGGKKVIQRKSEAKRENGSLLENTIIKLKTEHNITDDNKLFEIALELNITWLNRILFLKLFEARLLNIHNNDKTPETKCPKFLSYEVTTTYDKLNTLFFEVLAKKVGEQRKTVQIKQYKKIPYLNSSLFEPTELEQKYLRISNLKSTLTISNKDTALKNEDKKLPSLEYLLRFLNSYDFGTDDKADFKDDDTIINSAVLGLIFEKLNGYKMGSYFTPAYITMYMTRQTITKAVVDKFNQEFEIETNNFNELKNYCEQHSYKDDFRQKANKIINSITICDPAVGSGHFLVSSLNELIYIKSKLGILDNLGAYEIKLENDELCIENKESEKFKYHFNKNNKITDEIKEVQKAIFNQKLHIIENQLFGVDINPNSVKITRLRLWIELLKECYYDKNNELVTLPNIDINIKEGNSLISRFALNDDENDKQNNSKEFKKILPDYKKSVKEYKQTNKKNKKEITEKIQEIKKSFVGTLEDNSKFIKTLRTYVSNYGYSDGSLTDELLIIAIKNKPPTQTGFWKNDNNSNPQNSTTLQQGDMSPCQNEQEKNITKQSQKIEQKTQQKSLAKLLAEYKKQKEAESGKIYQNSFEWRFEFPEVLNQNGEFAGFDIIIGNPPYIMEDENKNAFNGLHDAPCYQGKTDIWHLFTCKAIKLAKKKGYVSFIAKNQWLNSSSASKMRKNIYKNTRILTIIDFGINMIFDDVGQQTMVFLLQENKTNTTHDIKFVKFNEKISNKKIYELLNKKNNGLEVSIKTIEKNYDENKNLTFSSSEKETILEKIDEDKNFKFDEKNEIIQGIIGGPDKAFIIKNDELNQYNKTEKEYIKMFHTNTQRYITNDTDKYIFYISKQKFTDNDLKDCPNIIEKLTEYKKQLSNRREVLKGRMKWFNIWWARDENFFKDGAKLVWAKRTFDNRFTYTEKQLYGSANLFYIKSDRVNLKYITALLNSRLMFFYMQERLKHTGDLLQIDKNQFLRIPLYVPKNTEPFIKLVDEILRTKQKITTLKTQQGDMSPCQNNTEQNEKNKTKPEQSQNLQTQIETLQTMCQTQESKIDDMVYKLYNLTADEIKIIENK
ncbi:MAG: class I SAM-dependent DNA methyltransferase [Gammaproteobacteria bacterium]|nr:MAG: class I SAM-dependent DNA methyltransferase [Gammaproteobacteria bacterium]